MSIWGAVFLYSLLFFVILRLISPLFVRKSKLEFRPDLSCKKIVLNTSSGNYLMRVVDADKYSVTCIKSSILPIRARFIMPKVTSSVKEGKSLLFQPSFFKSVVLGDRCTFELHIPRTFSKVTKVEALAKNVRIDGHLNEALGDLSLAANGGSLTLNNVVCRSLQARTTRGPMTLRKVRCLGRVDLSTVDGHMSVEALISNEVGLSAAGRGTAIVHGILARSITMVAKTMPFSLASATCHEVIGELQSGLMRFEDVQLVTAACFPGDSSSNSGKASSTRGTAAKSKAGEAPPAPRTMAELQNQLGRLMVRGQDGIVELRNVATGHVAVRMEGVGLPTCWVHTLTSGLEGAVEATGETRGQDYTLLSDCKKIHGTSGGGEGPQVIDLSSALGSVRLWFTNEPATKNELPPMDVSIGKLPDQTPTPPLPAASSSPQPAASSADAPAPRGAKDKTS
ncbi:hypothetical protein PAPYR_3723 [Paratrimastix pyriformis]|uniref:Adhesin domain-containing protein n=1 Tax=Paratrimastix pyriformis TaxID=342808 RepID=A0ABQ8UMH5_9EUKA|nr:hypothetical protein PAPYR_3723 [Paratrimastix pyriformis]